MGAVVVLVEPDYALDRGDTGLSADFDAGRVVVVRVVGRVAALDPVVELGVRDAGEVVVGRERGLVVDHRVRRRVLGDVDAEAHGARRAGFELPEWESRDECGLAGRSVRLRDAVEDGRARHVGRGVWGHGVGQHDVGCRAGADVPELDRVGELVAREH